VLDWARERHGARFTLSEGVTFVAQPDSSIEAIRAAFASVVGAPGDAAALRLAGLHVMTTLTGSALLALAVAEGFLDAEAAWKAAHVDEDFQMRAWGQDAEAMARRARRWVEMEAAAKVAGLRQ
jgi:chaperone required for assembly of F1-ATPase